MQKASALPEFAAPNDGALTADMRAAFDEVGVLVLRGFTTRAACEALRTRALELVDAFQPGDAHSVFSTLSNAQLADDYFTQSGSNIGFFFEEGAFDDEGRLKQAKVDCLNKMGHAMHDLDPVFDSFSRSPALANAARALGFADPKVVQSMYIFKPPGIGGEVVCHQDSTYIYTEPETCVGFWFAIDSADGDNACMEFLPGAHKGALRERNYRNAAGKLVTETIEAAPFPAIEPAPAEAEPGDLVIFHGRSPHMSAPNRSARSRHAYTLHIVDGVARWPEENWLQRPASLPFKGFDRTGAGNVA